MATNWTLKFIVQSKPHSKKIQNYTCPSKGIYRAIPGTRVTFQIFSVCYILGYASEDDRIRNMIEDSEVTFPFQIDGQTQVQETWNSLQRDVRQDLSILQSRKPRSKKKMFEMTQSMCFGSRQESGHLNPVLPHCSGPALPPWLVRHLGRMISLFWLRENKWAGIPGVSLCHLP